MTRNAFVAFVAFFFSFFMTGCFDIDGDGTPDISFGGQVCLGSFVEILDGGIGWDVCVGIGDGNMIGAPIQQDGLMIEITNRYAEQAAEDRNFRITQVDISCTITDSDRNVVPAASYVYTDGMTAVVYIPNIPSHFTADCTGNMTIGNGGPSSALFVDDNAVAETTLVMWEDEAVERFYERNGELTIRND